MLIFMVPIIVNKHIGSEIVTFPFYSYKNKPLTREKYVLITYL